MHLTNVAIQKKADDYDKEKDTKLDMMDLKIFMTSKHGSETTEKLFYEFEAIIIRSLGYGYCVSGLWFVFVVWGS